MMDVVVTTRALRRAKFQSIGHRQQTITQLFTGRMPFLLPIQQHQRTEFNGIAHPNITKSPGVGLPTLSLTTRGS